MAGSSPLGYIPPPDPNVVAPPPVGQAPGWPEQQTWPQQQTWPEQQNWPQQQWPQQPTQYPYPQPSPPVEHRVATAGTVDATGKVFPGLGISAIWIVTYFVLQIVVTLILFGFAIALDSELLDSLRNGDSFNSVQNRITDDLGWLALLGVAISGTIMTIVMALHLRKHRRWEVVGWRGKNQLGLPKTIGLAIGLMVGTLMLGGIYRLLLGGRELQGETTELLESLGNTPASAFLMLFSVAVVAPVVEELLFRAYLQNALARKIHPYLAIAVAAAVFGAIHLQFLAFPILALLGAVFGFLYHRTGSLSVTIALHMANNAFSVVMIMLAAN
jgi:membrane protease YdiL (CAAX protease family)